MKIGLTYSGAALLAALIVFSGQGEIIAATLTVENVFVLVGSDEVRVPILLESGAGEDVAGVQCDVLFDGDALSVTDVSTGQAASAAGKDAVFNHIASNQIRIIVAGFNINTISDGSVAEISFSIDGNAVAGTYAVSLQNVLMSNPQGGEVPSSGHDGAVVLQAAGDDSGGVRVTIEPSRAVNAGAQWRVDDGAWQDSGATLTDLVPAEYTVSFSAISGWDTPEPLSASVAAGETTNLSATYIRDSGWGGCGGGNKSSRTGDFDVSMLFACAVLFVLGKK